MANLSNVTYTAGGVATVFVVPFDYIEESDITVTVDDIVTTAFTFNGSGDIDFTVAPASGVVVYISRDSDVTTRVTTYADGSDLTEEDLNNGGDQSIYLHQETRDLITTLNADNASVVGRVTQNETDIASNTSDIADKAQGAASSTDNAIPRFDGTTGKIIQGSNVIIDDSDQMSGLNKVNTKHIHVDDTATADGKIGSHIMLDGAGYSGVEAIHIDYTSGAIPSDAVEDVIQVEIDDTLAASGGTINAVDISSVTSNAEVYGLRVGSGVNPIGQSTTAFRNMSSFLVNTVDKLSEVIDVASTTDVFNLVNDTITVGNQSKFTSIRIDKNLTYTYDMLLTFKYSTGVGTFSTFTPTDGTLGWLNDGDISWALTDITDWAKDANNEYTIKIERTVTGNYPTAYLSVKQVLVQGTVGYMWNEFGDTTMNSIQIASTNKISSILNEDDMISDSDTSLATQQSIKAYADTKASASSVSNVDNTSDADKPVSTATQTALDLKQDELITTRGDTIIGNSSGAAERLAVGTAGQVLKSDGTDVAWGTGGGAGGINYLTDDDTDFESSVGNWVSSGTGLTVSRVASDLLRGSGYMKYSRLAFSSGVSAESPVFTIDKADLAKKLTISFDYETLTPDYADGNIRVEIIQDPNGTPILIRPNGEDIQAGSGTHYAQFQTDHTEQEYQLRFTLISNGAFLHEIAFDNVIVGPTKLAYGTIVTDPIDYTPSIISGLSLGNGTITGNYTRSGKMLSGFIKVTLGSTSSIGDLIVGLPSGLIVDSSLITIGEQFTVGESSLVDTGTGYYNGKTKLASTSSLKIMDITTSGSYASSTYMTATTPFTWTTGDEVIIRFNNIPIVGWSSNTQMSEDLGGREIVAKGAGNGGTSLTANVTNIDFTETKDTTASFDGTTFTAPETGEYLIEGFNSITTATEIVINAYINGTVDKIVGYNGSVKPTVNINGVFSLNKGDQLSFRSDAAVTLSNTTTGHYISITKLASPQTILETETVAAKYTSSDAQSFSNGAADAVVTYEELVYDTHNAVSGGIFTVPVSGHYSIKGKIALDSLTANTGAMQMGIKINGTTVEAIDNSISHQTRQSIDIESDFQVNKGDTISISLQQVNGATRSLFVGSSRNVFTVHIIK